MVINQSTMYDFTIVLWHRITIIAFVLQLIWYYNTSWVSIIGNLVLVLILWCRIIKCRWFCMLGIIVRNFLNIGNDWPILEKYTAVVKYPAGKYWSPGRPPPTSPGHPLKILFDRPGDVPILRPGDVLKWRPRDVLIWRSRDVPGRLIRDVPRTFSGRSLVDLESTHTWISENFFNFSFRTYSIDQI